MLALVRSLWDKLDKNRGNLELDLPSVANLLCDFKALPDQSTAMKYICNAIHKTGAGMIDYDDFNSIFCKGIFK